jgi:hypothetical protein
MGKCDWTDCEKVGVVDLYSGKFCVQHARTEYARWLQDEERRHEQALLDFNEVFTAAMERAGEQPEPPAEDTNSSFEQ